MKIIDKGFNAITREMERMAQVQVDVGILIEDAGKVSESGTPLGEYAVYNVYGTETVPQRDFMAGTEQAYTDKLLALQRSHLSGVIDGSMTASRAVTELAEWYQGAMQSHILNGDWTPNAPSTVARKGSSQPLIDAKLLFNNIKHRVT